MNPDLNLLVSHIKSLASANGNLRLTQAEEELRAVLSAVDVEFLDEHREKLHRRYHLGNAVREARFVRVCFELNPPAAGESSSEVLSGSGEGGVMESNARELRPPERPASPPNGPGGERERLGMIRFIREFDRCERQNPFMWAGFVIKQLLPGLGIEGPQAKQFLRRLEAGGIVTTVKEPNPRNPEHPTTRVKLNRNHSLVREALNENARLHGFRPIKIPGGPLSEDIIRDRR